MKTMKSVSMRAAIAVNSSQELRALSKSKYSTEWVQVNDSLISDGILYLWVYLGDMGMWAFVEKLDKLDDGNLKMDKTTEKESI